MKKEIEIDVACLGTWDGIDDIPELNTFHPMVPHIDPYHNLLDEIVDAANSDDRMPKNWEYVAVHDSDNGAANTPEGAPGITDTIWRDACQRIADKYWPPTPDHIKARG